MKTKLDAIRILEEQLAAASPSDCARITKELVRLKDALIHPNRE